MKQKETRKLKVSEQAVSFMGAGQLKEILVLLGGLKAVFNTPVIDLL